MFCATCRLDHSDFDQTDVGHVCENCGTLAETSNIVSHNAFTSDGVPEGTLVSRAPRKAAVSLGGGVRRAYVKTSWDPFARGKNEINKLAHLIDAPFDVIQGAANTYKLCLIHNFTSGRHVRHAAAACLYISGRLCRHPVFMSDFSARIPSLSVVSLGRTVLKLTNILKIAIPPILGVPGRDDDPSLYLTRFAGQLDFQLPMRQIVNTSSHLVRCMQANWLHWGRYPQGLFGAALLISGKMHGVSRTRREVAKVMGVSETTIGQRVREFEASPASCLTLKQLQEAESRPSLQTANPPAFERSRRAWKDPELNIPLWPAVCPARSSTLEAWIREGEDSNKNDDCDDLRELDVDMALVELASDSFDFACRESKSRSGGSTPPKACPPNDGERDCGLPDCSAAASDRAVPGRPKADLDLDADEFADKKSLETQTTTSTPPRADDPVSLESLPETPETPDSAFEAGSALDDNASNNATDISSGESGSETQNLYSRLNLSYRPAEDYDDDY